MPATNTWINTSGKGGGGGLHGYQTPVKWPTSAAQTNEYSGAATMGQTNLQMEDLLGQMALENQGLNVQASGLNLGEEYGAAQLGIQQGQNLLQQQGLAAQDVTNAQQQGIEQSIYGTQQTQYPEQFAEASNQYKTNQQLLQGQLAATGTLGTQGSKLQQGNLAQQYAWQKQDIGRAQSTAEQQQQSEQVGYQGQVTQDALTQQNLELAAAANGISYDQMQAQYDQQMGQLGIQGGQDLNSMYSQFAGLTGQQQSALAGQIANNSLLSGFNVAPSMTLKGS